MRISDWSSDVCSSDLFAAIVAVDRPRRIKAGDAMLQREPRARAHLHLVTRRNRHREARRDRVARAGAERQRLGRDDVHPRRTVRSEEHTSELQSLMRISYAVFCLKKKNTTKHTLAQY